MQNKGPAFREEGRPFWHSGTAHRPEKASPCPSLAGHWYLHKRRRRAPRIPLRYVALALHSAPLHPGLHSDRPPDSAGAARPPRSRSRPGDGEARTPEPGGRSKCSPGCSAMERQRNAAESGVFGVTPPDLCRYLCLPGHRSLPARKCAGGDVSASSPAVSFFDEAINSLE